MAENKRAPFDMPEGESEIVAGYHTEYSGMRFGLFFMAEFIEVIVIAALMTAIFLGGWSIPWLTTATLVGGLEPFLGGDFANLVAMVAHVLTFILKVVVMIGLQMSLRWSLPRFRYDQTMDLCWKILLPLSIANVFVTGTILLLVKGLG
jgi:NADH-quinone oxidoreductase subunit H